MPAALPWITAAATGYNLGKDLGWWGPQPISYGTAMNRAQGAVNPLYDQSMQDRLRQVQAQNIRTGFFGQAPGAAISQQAIANLEAQRNAQIAQLASQMQGQSAAQAAVAPNPLQSVATATQGFGELWETFPDAMRQFTQTTGGWFGGGGASATQPDARVNLTTAYTQAAPHWSPPGQGTRTTSPLATQSTNPYQLQSVGPQGNWQYPYGRPW